MHHSRKFLSKRGQADWDSGKHHNRARINFVLVLTPTHIVASAGVGRTVGYVQPAFFDWQCFVARFTILQKTSGHRAQMGIRSDVDDTH